MRMYALLLAALAALFSTSPAMANKGEWRIKTTTSKLDDSTNVMLITSIQKKMSDGFEIRPTFGITCKENKTYAFLIGKVAGYGYGPKQIKLRHGKEKVYKTVWQANRMNLYPKTDIIPFLKKVMAQDTLIMEVTPLSYGPTILEFDTSGLKEAIKPLRKACHW